MLHLLLACTGPTDSPVPAEVDDSAAPDEVVPNPLAMNGVQVDAASVVTVLNVRWSTAQPSRARVTATFTDGSVSVDEVAEDVEHAVQLVGLPPLAAVTVRVEATDGTGAWDEVETTTGQNPSWVPDLTWSAESPDSAESGFTVLSLLMVGGSGLVVLDDRGRAVWAWPTEDEPLSVPVARARLSLDGKAIVYMSPAFQVGFPATIYRVALDGSGAEETPVTEAHIDFTEFTPGGYASFAWDLRVIDGRKLMGQRLIERDPDGTERVLWNAWDYFSPDLSLAYGRYYSSDPEVEDWTHINGIYYDAAEDAYYLTMTYQSTVLKIDGETGEQIWALTDGGTGDFANPASEEFLAYPHSAQPVDGGVLVFNRSNFELGSGCSHADEIQLNEESWEASLRWQYGPDECLLVPFLGSAQRLPAGNTLIAWTTAGQLDEVTPDGAIAWRVNTAFGAGVGFATRVATLTPG